MTAPSGDSETESATEGVAGNGYTGVGALLRASRERRDEELPDVARMLRIRYPYMEAIELGEFNRLPGATYAAGFIRAYSDHLGLDSEEIIRRYKMESADGGAKQDLSFPTPVPETGIPGGAFVFIGLVVFALAYVGWYMSTTKDDYFADLISPIPDRLSSLLESEETIEPTADEQPEPQNLAVTPIVEKTAEPAITESGSAGTTVPDQVVEPDLPAVAEVPVSEPTPEPEQDAVSSSSPGDGVVSGQVRVPVPGVSPDVAIVSEAVQSSEPVPVVDGGVDGGVDRAADVTALVIPAARSETDAAPIPDDSNNTVSAQQPSEGAAETVSAPADATSVAATSVAATADQTSSEPPVSASDDSLPAQTPEITQPIVVVKTPDPAPIADPEPVQNSNSDPEPASEPTSASTSEAAQETLADVVDQTDAVVSETVSDPAPAPDADQTLVTAAPTTSEEEAAFADQGIVTATETASVSPSEPAVLEAPRIIIKAIGDSWIQVRDDINAEMLVTRLLQTGESFEVPNRTGLILLTGNAGALSIVVDGVEAPSIGGPGVVRRGVELDPEKLRSGTAISQ